MATAAPPLMRPLTADDLDMLPDSDDRYEIINGELVVTPRPVPQHQQVSGRLYRAFSRVIEDGGIGLVYSSPIRIRLSEHDVVDPDLSVFTTAQRSLVTDRLVDGVPVLIVEILSPSTQRNDSIVKMALYQRSGVLDCWVVDPVAKTVAIHALSGGRYQPVDNVGGFARSSIVEGLAVDVEALFTDLW